MGLSREGYNAFMNECIKLQRNNPMWNRYLLIMLSVIFAIFFSVSCLLLLITDVTYGNNFMTLLLIALFFAPLMIWNSVHNKYRRSYNTLVYDTFDGEIICFDRYSIIEDPNDGAYNFSFMFSELSDSQLDVLWLYSRMNKVFGVAIKLFVVIFVLLFIAITVNSFI